jgi:hypothetical protein
MEVSFHILSTYSIWLILVFSRSSGTGTYRIPDLSDDEEEVEAEEDGFARSDDYKEDSESDTPIESTERSSVPTVTIDLTQEQTEPLESFRGPKGLSEKEIEEDKKKMASQICIDLVDEEERILSNRSTIELDDGGETEEEMDVEDSESESESESDAEAEVEAESDAEGEVAPVVDLWSDFKSSEDSEFDSDFADSEISVAGSPVPTESKTSPFLDHKDIPISNQRPMFDFFPPQGTPDMNGNSQVQHTEERSRLSLLNADMDPWDDSNLAHEISSPEQPVVANSSLSLPRITCLSDPYWTKNVDYTAVSGPKVSSPPNPSVTFQYKSYSPPSPSDAALAKKPSDTTLFPTSDAQSSSKSGNFYDIFSETPITTHELAEKSGKLEFFTARESNKSKIQPKKFVEYDWTGLKPQAPTQPRLYNTPGHFCRAKRRVQREAINPTACASTISDPFCISDGPSNFEASSNNSTTHRAAVTISDIVEQPVERTAGGLKRKADDISDVADEELRIWASVVPGESSTEEKEANIPDQSRTEPSAVEVITETVVPPNTNRETSGQQRNDSEPRATKRLKRFAEALGYAALGGVAVSAGLFSVLIATAPSAAELL